MITYGFIQNDSKEKKSVTATIINTKDIFSFFLQNINWLLE